MTYVGAGMICPHIVNLSLLFGAVISWGLMWPLIDGRKGEWYPAELPTSSMRSLQGYKVLMQLIIAFAILPIQKLTFRVSVWTGLYRHRSPPWRWNLQFSQDNSVFRKRYSCQIAQKIC